jgi:Aspartokinases
MKIYKFGGASVKSADGVRNLLRIAQLIDEPLVIVVSAMGKMTNALERVVRAFYERKPSLMNDFEEVRNFHEQIISDLFGDNNKVIETIYNDYISKLEEIIKGKPSKNYDYEYDRIVPFGELLSTTIVSIFLNEHGKRNKFVDVRTCLKTDDNYREGNIDIDLSRKFVAKSFVCDDVNCFVTQGFIASSLSGENTTLGREGSDYSAAILANLLGAESVSIWKDVPGVMNADPKRYQDVVIISRMNYKRGDRIKLLWRKRYSPQDNKAVAEQTNPAVRKVVPRPSSSWYSD